MLRRRSEPPLLPPSLRRGTTAVVAVAVIGFAALALRYAGGSSARWFDGRFQSLVDHITPRPRALALLIQIGSPAVVVTTAILTALACLWFGRRRLALLAILGPGLAGAVTTLSKPLIGRTVDGAWAYPSGHTGGATSLALVAAVVLVALLRPNRLLAATLIGASSVLAGAAMTVLLVAADWHYATDAVGGFFVAVAVVLGCALLIDVLFERRRTSDTVYHSRG